MPSIHGKNAVIYLGAAGSAAIPIGEQLSWDLNFDMATVDVTPLNAGGWKTFVKGLQGYTGTFGGNFDTSSVQLWLASTSTTAEKFYIYPDVASAGRYYYGTAWIQLGKIAAGSTTTKVANDVKFTGTGVLGFN